MTEVMNKKTYLDRVLCAKDRFNGCVNELCFSLNKGRMKTKIFIGMRDHQREFRE